MTAIASLSIVGLRELIDGRPTTARRFDGVATTDATIAHDELIPQPYLARLADRAEQLLDGPEEPPKTAMKAP